MRFLNNCFILLLFSVGHSLSYSQSNIAIPDSINSFIFSKAANNQIKLISPFGSHILKDSVFVYEKFKSPDFSNQISGVGRPLNNSEYRSIVLNEKLHLFHNGGGVVFEEFEGSFRRVDNSTLHLNQGSGFYFEIDNICFLIFIASGCNLLFEVLSRNSSRPPFFSTVRIVLTATLS